MTRSAFANLRNCSGYNYKHFPIDPLLNISSVECYKESFDKRITREINGVRGVDGTPLSIIDKD